MFRRMLRKIRSAIDVAIGATIDFFSKLGP